MNDATPKKREWQVIRVFVSSTFADFKHERDALHQNVFRNLELHCKARGFQFQAIDLRWGVPMEAALDHRTMQICFEELRRSQQISPQPNFLILLGNRYGWRPLPEVISAEEFGRLLTTAIDNHSDYRGRSATQILKQWYVQDENSRPAKTASGGGDYLLMSRLSTFKDDERDYGKIQPKPETLEEDTPEWKNVETALWDVVNATYKPDDLISRFAGFNGRATDDLPQIVRFQASATEQEIWRGAFCVEHAHDHVLAFIREIDGVKGHPVPAQIRSFIDVKRDNQIDTVAGQALADLKKQLRTRLVDGNVISLGRVRLEEIQNENGGRIFDTSQGHLESMCQQVEAQLKTIIDRQMDEFQGPQDTTAAERAHRGLQQEQREHERFGEERARADVFVGREPELRRIEGYLGNKPGHPGETPLDFRQPLVITGVSGSGKTALLSRAFAVARSNEISEDRQPILRLLGISPQSSDLRGLLRSLCLKLRLRNPRDGDIPQDINELNKELYEHFEAATAVKTVHIFLDALDQLSDADNGRVLHWLRRDPLPEHVKLVVSCLSDRAGRPGGEPLSALEARKIPETNFVRLDVLSEREANTLLFDRWLPDAKRSVTVQQRQRIESRLKAPECHQPLYLKILFEEVRLWRSFDNDEGVDLAGDVPKLLQAFFERLSASTNHGPTVEFAMGYLASARRGLTEIEVLEILYREREYANSEYGLFLDDMMQQTGHRLPDEPKRIPIAIWSRLRFDLAPYLTEHAAPGGTVLNFYHRNLFEAVRQRYLPSEEQQRQAHMRLAEYFNAQEYWQESLEDQQRRAKTLPLTPRRANVRKVDELPWQLLQATDWQGSQQLLTDLPFLEAKAQAGMIFDLSDDLGAAARAMPEGSQRSSLLAVKDALIKEIPLLEHSPELMFQQVTNRLAKTIPSSLITWKSDRPWFRLRSRAPWEFESEITAIWKGCFPMVFSHDGLLAFTFDPEGSLLETEVNTGRSRIVWKGVCQSGRLLSQDKYDGYETLMLVSDVGRVVIGRSNSGEILNQLTLPLKAGWKIASCVRTRMGLLAIVTHFNHSPAELVLFTYRAQTINARTVALLGFGYLDTAPLALLNDSRHALCIHGKQGRQIALIDYERGIVLRLFCGHERWIKACCPLEHMDLLFTGSWDGTMRVWRLSTGELLDTIGGEYTGITDIAWSAKYEALIALGPTRGSGSRMVIQAWRVHQGGKPKVTHAATHFSTRCALSPDEDFLVTGVIPDSLHGERNELQIWHMKSLLPSSGNSVSESSVPVHHGTWIKAIHIQRNPDQAITISADGQCRGWDLASATLAWQHEAIPRHPIVCTISADGSYIACCYSVGSISNPEDDGLPVRFSDDYGCKLFVYRLFSGSRDPVVEPVSRQFERCFWVPGQLRIMLVQSGQVTLWDIASGKDVWMVSGNRPLVWPDASKVLIDNSTHGCPTVYEMESAAELKRFDVQIDDLVDWSIWRNGSADVIALTSRNLLLKLDAGAGKVSGYISLDTVHRYDSLILSECGTRAFLCGNGIELWDLKAEKRLAWFPSINQVGCIAVVNRDLVVVGDDIGWLWFLEVAENGGRQ